jgi:hypothetical protein
VCSTGFWLASWLGWFTAFLMKGRGEASVYFNPAVAAGRPAGGSQQRAQEPTRQGASLGFSYGY